MSDIDDLRAEFQRQNEETQQELAVLREAEVRRQQHGRPLPAAATMRSGYAASEAEREAAKQPAEGGEGE
jgi:hypothetical protein